MLRNKRSHASEKPTHHTTTKSSPRSSQLGKARAWQQRPNAAQKNQKKTKKMAQQLNHRKGRASDMREPGKTSLPHPASSSHNPSLWLTLYKDAFFSLPADRGCPQHGGAPASHFPSSIPLFLCLDWLSLLPDHQMLEFLEALS